MKVTCKHCKDVYDSAEFSEDEIFNGFLLSHAQTHENKAQEKIIREKYFGVTS